MNSVTSTRTAALARLSAFVPRAGREYADGRNFDTGPDQPGHVSRLSPAIRHRLISEEEVVRAVLAQHSITRSEKFVQEVLWRTYWKGWLEIRPAIWTRFVAERGEIARTGGLENSIAQAEAGATGIEGFDDWARELVATGYLHNHARMWFASIWIFTLRLPWVLGADFFLRHLIDADPASNTLSWRWVAGLQTAGKTYLATADNIARNTGGRFHPKGLASSAVALSEDEPVPPVRPLAPVAAHDRHEPVLLLLTGEDLSPETMLPPDAAIAGIHAVEGVRGWPWRDKAAGYVAAGIGDAAQRCAAAFGCEAEIAPIPEAESIAAAAEKAGVRTVLTAFAPVGPVADALAALSKDLTKHGIALHQPRRAWDDLFWPHATKGFFPFREKIPALLGELGIGV